MTEPLPLTPTQLRCLADWLPILEAPDFNPGEWRGGEADADGGAPGGVTTTSPGPRAGS